MKRWTHTRGSGSCSTSSSRRLSTSFLVYAIMTTYPYRRIRAPWKYPFTIMPHAVTPRTAMVPSLKAPTLVTQRSHLVCERQRATLLHLHLSIIMAIPGSHRRSPDRIPCSTVPLSSSGSSRVKRVKLVRLRPRTRRSHMLDAVAVHVYSSHILSGHALYGLLVYRPLHYLGLAITYS